MQVQNGEIPRQKPIQKLLASIAKKRSTNCPPARPLVRSFVRLFCNEKASRIVSYKKERAQEPLAPTFGHMYERVGKRQVAGGELSHRRLSGNVGSQSD